MAKPLKARRLPRDTGESGWLGIIGEIPSYPELDANIAADVVVVGAGFTGLSAARQLAANDSSARIAVLDAERVASGPAGRNSGFMVDLPHNLGSENYATDTESDKQEIVLNRTAQDFAKDAAAEYGMPPEAVDACGRINGAAGETAARHNRNYAAHLDRLGEKYTHLSASDMERITGSTFYAGGGVFFPGGVMLQPALYITRLAKGIAWTGAGRVQIFERSPALELRREGAGWRVRAPGGSVSAGKVILAVNGHAESFGFFKGRLLHVFTYASMTAPLDSTQREAVGGEEKWSITPSDPMGTSIRRIDGLGGNRILVRNRWSCDPSMEIGEARLRRFARSHRKGLLRRFPQLGGVGFEYQWGGRLCLSLNSVPAFGEVDTNLIAACCQNGLGTTKGTLAGMAAADLVTGRESEALQSMRAFEAPSRLPLWPISLIGTKSVIAFREFKARKEL